MKYFGLDIGTTTVSVVLVENGQVTASRTLPNGAFLPTENPWEKLQDVGAIRTAALGVAEELLTGETVAAIGVTGQMHGILYLNAAGEPVSPLYTWQDGRGNQPYTDGLTYVDYLQRETGYPVATGYGLVTHFYNLKNGMVPETAVTFCTVHDYLAMLLCGNARPLTDASDAASLGLFDVRAGRFDTRAMEKVGIDPALLPALAPTPQIGYRGHAPVFVAIGDNQASFLGATGGQVEAMLINVGTGSQFSAYTKEYLACPGLETRPFPGGGYLLVGSALCGGRAFALLESFLRETVGAMTGVTPDTCYKAIDALLQSAPPPEDLPTLVPLFQGTRQDPTLRGSIQGLSTENFTPRHLIWAMLEGMVAELKDMYDRYLAAGGVPAPLRGSGNGLRKNPPLRACYSRAFGQPVTMSDCREEAATGAALFAAGNL